VEERSAQVRSRRLVGKDDGQNLEAPAVVTERLRRGWTQSRQRVQLLSNSSERERVRPSSRDEPTGRSRSSPWARRRLRYGSETVTLSPDAEMLKVPDDVLAAYV
jgi:hypothetical protein